MRGGRRGTSVGPSRGDSGISFCFSIIAVLFQRRRRRRRQRGEAAGVLVGGSFVVEHRFVGGKHNFPPLVLEHAAEFRNHVKPVLM
jgi:hypothetical protein